MRVFVTGVAGFIGSHVAERLLAAGDEVLGCDDLSTGQRENVPAGVAWLPHPAERVDPIDADVVVHLAAISSARHPDPAEVWRRNLGMAAQVLAASRCAGARVVFASTAAAADGRSAYARAKLAAEELALAHDATVLRFANVYGPRQRTDGADAPVIAAWDAARAAGNQIRVDGDGSQTRDFVHVRDVAEIVFRACRAPAGDGRIVDVCTGVQVPIQQLALAYAPEHEWEHGERADDDPDQVVQDPSLAERLYAFRPAALSRPVAA